MNSCFRCYVSGRVQGVWFRASTQAQAEVLGLTGYARNLADGRVEVLACGEAESLALLKTWLRQGPDGAKVEALECGGIDTVPPSDFSTG